MWTITRTQNEAAYLEDLIRGVITETPPRLPPHDQRVGHIDTHWNQVGPGLAYVVSNPDMGTPDDRRVAEAVVLTQLQPHGFMRAAWSLFPAHKTADWDEVQQKAQRLVQSGAVHINRNSYNTILATVAGDGTDNDGQPDTHNVEIMRQDPQSQAITGSHCDCDWGQFQNLPRTRNWKRYQNRPCSHIMATYWVASAMPLDEDRQPGGENGQMSLFGPASGGDAPQSMGLMQRSPYIDPRAWWLTPESRQPGNIDQPISQGGMMPSPGGMGGPQGGAGGVPGVAPSPESALPQYPMEGGPPPLPEVNPASVPGGRPGPTPTNPLQYPGVPGAGGTFSRYNLLDGWGGTFSSYDPYAAIMGSMSASLYHTSQSFNNGDVVLLTQNTMGNLMGRPEVAMQGVGFGPQTPGKLQYNPESGEPIGVTHGDLGDPITVPRGAVGEVMGTDPSTQMVNVLWTGNAFDQNTQKQPFGATFWAWPSELKPARTKAPGPAIRRT